MLLYIFEGSYDSCMYNSLQHLMLQVTNNRLTYLSWIKGTLSRYYLIAFVIRMCRYYWIVCDSHEPILLNRFCDSHEPILLNRLWFTWAHNTESYLWFTWDDITESFVIHMNRYYWIVFAISMSQYYWIVFVIRMSQYYWIVFTIWLFGICVCSDH